VNSRFHLTPTLGRGMNPGIHRAPQALPCDGLPHPVGKQAA
jgi:hypothetical protein